MSDAGPKTSALFTDDERDLAAVFGLQLSQDTADLVPNREHGQSELRCNLSVRQPSGDQPRQLPLPSREWPQYIPLGNAPPSARASTRFHT